MADTQEKIVAVILVGGPTKGTRFRPLSLSLAKPLIPLAGQPMVQHPILSCTKIPNLAHIYLVGFYEEKVFALYTSALSNELRVPVRYVREEKPHGSAGGLFHLRDLILEDDPCEIIVMNCDVCSSFPLADILAAHRQHKGIGTLLVKKVSPEVASDYGTLVADSETGEVLHYVERPETFVSDLINCGVYIFTPEIFVEIEKAISARKSQAVLRPISSYDALHTVAKQMIQADYFRMDQDVLSSLAGKKKLYTFETEDFWEQIKVPGMSIRCSSLYLERYRTTAPGLLAKMDGQKGPKIIGDVVIHPSAKAHPTSKIGPNVSISASARIGPGARLISCIILDDVEVKDNAVVINSIIGWKSSIGRWARVQGGGDYKSKLSISILGEDVTVEDEVVVSSCIVLSHKTLSRSVREEIIL